MKSASLKRVSVFVIFLSFGLFFLSTGCRKKKDTIANVYVYDSNNASVSGASVRLYGTSTTNPGKPPVIDYSTTTDASGLASFNLNDMYQLGQSGVAVLNIAVTKETLSGTGIIKCDQEKTSEVAVFIN
jgi:hypothetical protein